MKDIKDRLVKALGEFNAACEEMDAAIEQKTEVEKHKGVMEDIRCFCDTKDTDRVDAWLTLVIARAEARRIALDKLTSEDRDALGLCGH